MGHSDDAARVVLQIRIKDLARMSHEDLVDLIDTIEDCPCTSLTDKEIEQLNRRRERAYELIHW